jgi:uncharacterized membrane protein YgcG
MMQFHEIVRCCNKCIHCHHSILLFTYAVSNDNMGRENQSNQIPTTRTTTVTILIGLAAVMIMPFGSDYALAQESTGPLEELGRMLGLNTSNSDTPVIIDRPTMSSSNAPHIKVDAVRYDEGEFSDEIIGEVTNNGTGLARFVEIGVTYYDAAGIITGTDFTYADPSDLQPGDTAPFNLFVSEDDAQEADSFNMRVSWNDITHEEFTENVLTKQPISASGGGDSSSSNSNSDNIDGDEGDGDEGGGDEGGGDEGGGGGDEGPGA